MIVVYGRLDDPPIASAVRALRDGGARHVVVEQAALGHEGLRIDAGAEGVGGLLVAAGQAFALESIAAVYARPLEVAAARAGDAQDRERAERFQQLFVEWLDVAPALVVNRPRAMRANASKPLQLQMIGAAGFLVPDTLVTNDAQEVLAFRRQHGRVVFKSTSGIRSIVRELDSRACARLDLLAALPVQFQAWVPGVDVRVHVVGERTFAVRIESGALDYRYAERDGLPVRLSATALPPDCAGRCVALAREMELALAGIDLRLRPDGRYVCFEVNPMPAYSYFEAHTGLPIGEALAALLVEAAPGPRESENGRVRRGADRDGAGDREPDGDQRTDRVRRPASVAR